MSEKVSSMKLPKQGLFRKLQIACAAFIMVDRNIMPGRVSTGSISGDTSTSWGTFRKIKAVDVLMYLNWITLNCNNQGNIRK